jgi:hypothetical protein
LNAGHNIDFASQALVLPLGHPMWVPSFLLRHRDHFLIIVPCISDSGRHKACPYDNRVLRHLNARHNIDFASRALVLP